MSAKEIKEYLEYHREGIREIWNNKIRKKGMGFPAGALYTLNGYFNNLRISIGKNDKVTAVSTAFAAGARGSAERADFLIERKILHTLMKSFINIKN